MKSRKKNNIKITTIYIIYKPVEQTHYCVEVFFRLSREKERTVYVLSKNLHQSISHAQNESCLAYKETENGWK